MKERHRRHRSHRHKTDGQSKKIHTAILSATSDFRTRHQNRRQPTAENAIFQPLEDETGSGDDEKNDFCRRTTTKKKNQHKNARKNNQKRPQKLTADNRAQDYKKKKKAFFLSVRRCCPHHRGVRGQVDVPPLQVVRPVDLAPLLARRQGFQHGLGEGERAVGHADTTKLAHNIPSS